MKTKILLTLIALSITLSAWSQQTAAADSSRGKLPLTIGYLVAIETRHEKLEIIRTLDLADVYTLSEIHFPGNCVDFSAELRQSVFYELRSRNKTLYVEIKRINNNGKFRRLSNRQFRTLVQTQNLASQITQP